VTAEVAEPPRAPRTQRPAPQAPRWAEPVSGASLAAVRIALGLVAALSAVRIAANGWIDALYAGPTHRFTYVGLGWVPQPSAPVATALVVAIGVAGVALAVGWRCRVAAAVLLVAFGWIELIDVTTYLNHYWFVTLLAVLSVVVPVGRALSLDARRQGPRPVARGWVWLVRFQVGVVYAFAGLAKLQTEWLAGRPLELWLPARSALPVVGPLLEQPGAARLLAVAGAAFDCSIVPLLVWRRTRFAAWLVLVAFHVCTWLLFPIGVFPWLMIGASTIFFEPRWPLAAWAAASRRLPAARRIRARRVPADRPRVVPAPVSVSESVSPAGSRRRLLGFAAIAWVVVQLALPLRHLAYPGDHRWSGQGYRFAWNVLLTERAGSATFVVTDPRADRTWIADLDRLYTPTQVRVMSGEPDLIHQVARTIAAEERARGRDVEVTVDAWVSFNGRPAARIIDPTVDLAAEPLDIWSDDWILPRP
jgi:hypothetical protein